MFFSCSFSVFPIFLALSEVTCMRAHVRVKGEKNTRTLLCIHKRTHLLVLVMHLSWSLLSVNSAEKLSQQQRKTLRPSIAAFVAATAIIFLSPVGFDAAKSVDGLPASC